MSIRETQLKEKLAAVETGKSSLAPRVDPAGWTFINRWKVEPQRDDRTPMRGRVADRVEPASARRSFARRTHQENFKTWSKERHD